MSTHRGTKADPYFAGEMTFYVTIFASAALILLWMVGLV